MYIHIGSCRILTINRNEPGAYASEPEAFGPGLSSSLTRFCRALRRLFGGASKSLNCRTIPEIMWGLLLWLGVLRFGAHSFLKDFWKLQAFLWVRRSHVQQKQGLMFPGQI